MLKHTSKFRLLAKGCLVAGTIVLSLPGSVEGLPVPGLPKAQSPWQEEFVIWPRHPEQSTPWRNDPRFAGRFEDGFPDDLQVWFRNPGPAVKDEIMWVTVIDHYPPTDVYLGIVVNEPFKLTTVRQKDNVIFRYNEEFAYLEALSESGVYNQLGIPPRARVGILWEIYEGIRQYRLGNFGHNEEAIDKCIEILSVAIPKLPQTATPHDHHTAHFVLGRCHAEKYQSDLAIEHFRKAIDFRQNDVDAHMSLLAEYSLKVHPIDPAPLADASTWEELFVTQLEYVRKHFPGDKTAMGIIDRIFDESRASLSELSEEELRRRRKVGFGVFRWKRH